MSLACTLVSFTLLLVACLLSTSRALPIPTTLPPIPRRFIDPSFEKDGFSIDYTEVTKRPSLVQQAHDNVKKFNRNWGPTPSNEYYENGFYTSNPYKEQDSRNYIETNSIPQEKYYNSYEVEGYFPDEDFSHLEEEANYNEPIYVIDVPALNTVPTSDPMQVNYQTDSQLLTSYQTTPALTSIFVGNDMSSKEYECNLDKEPEYDLDNSREDTDIDFDDLVAHDIPTITLPQPTSLQPLPTTNKSLQKLPQQGGKQGTASQQQVNVLDSILVVSERDSGEMDSKLKGRDLRTTKSSVRTFLSAPQQSIPSSSSSTTPSSLPSTSQSLPSHLTSSTTHSTSQTAHPPTSLPHASLTSTSPPHSSSSSTSHTTIPPSHQTTSTKQTALEEQMLVEPNEKIPPKEIFSRITTITKTTTWFTNGDEGMIVFDDMEGKPQHVKAKYTKTTKTTTSGPVPWYVQGFEDVIFEEENGKSKTILDKMPHLKSLNPTSITSFTTAPNPWSSEVHEEVVFEDVANPKDSKSESELKAQYLGPHPSPLENIVEYLPRTQKGPQQLEENIKEECVKEKHNNGNKEQPIKEEHLIEIVPIEINSYSDTVIADKITVIETDSLPHPSHSQFYIPPNVLPQLEAEACIEEELLTLETPKITSNLLTTPKPVNENVNAPPTQAMQHNANQSYLPQAPTHHIPDQSYLSTQPNYLASQGYPSIYSSTTQAPDVRRDKWESRNEHQPQQNRENYQTSNVDHLQPPHQQQKIDLLSKDDPYRMQRAPQMGSQEAKRPMYQNRQFPSRPTRSPRDL